MNVTEGMASKASGGFLGSVPVQQGGNSPLTVLPSACAFVSAGGTCTISVGVAQGASWSVGSLPSWLSAERTTGTGSGTFTLTAGANAGSSALNAAFSVTANGYTSPVSVTATEGAFDEYLYTSATMTATNTSLNVFTYAESDYATAQHYSLGMVTTVWSNCDYFSSCQNPVTLANNTAYGVPPHPGYASWSVTVALTLDTSYSVVAQAELDAQYTYCCDQSNNIEYEDPFGYSLIDSGGIPLGDPSIYESPTLISGYVYSQVVAVEKAVVVIGTYPPSIGGIQVDGTLATSMVVGTSGYVGVYGQHLGIGNFVLTCSGAGITDVLFASDTQVNLAYSVDSSAPVGSCLLTVSDPFGSSSAATDVVPQVTITGDVGVPPGGTNTWTVTLSTSSTAEPIEVSIVNPSSGTGVATFADGTTSMVVTQTTAVALVGVVVSDTANNIALIAKPQRDGYRTLTLQELSVPKVTITLRNLSSQTLSPGDTGFVFYSIVTGNNILGQVYASYPPQVACSMGVELVGTVIPTNYEGTVTLRRTITSLGTWAGSSPADTDVTTGPDTSINGFLDTNPQSCTIRGCSAGNVYDIDAPGIGTLGGISRTRKNFIEYATMGGPNIPTAKAVKVSSDFQWWARSSCTIQSGRVAFSNDVTGDNQSGVGTTPITWNLQ